MIKAEVAARLAGKTGISHAQSVGALEIFLGCIKSALEQGEKVSLVGFGTFCLKKRSARNGRNPRTGKKIQIPRKCVVAFKPGKSLRQAVKESPDVSPHG